MSRTDFEAAYIERYGHRPRGWNDDFQVYQDAHANGAWFGWQARAAGIEAKAAPVADPDCDRSACGDFSSGPCDNPDCPALRSNKAAPVGEREAAIDWYNNADWGNECFKDGVVRGFQAGAAYQRAQQPQSAEAAAWAAQNVSSGKYGYIWHEESDVRGWINLQHQSDNSTWRGPIALYTNPQPSAGVVMPDARLLEFATSRWQAEVANRPLVNVHRRALDGTWRQVIRFAGGDPDALCGPSHDELVASLNGKEVGRG